MTGSAQRMQLYRHRQRRGLVPLQLAVDEVAIAQLLIANRYLSPAAEDDRGALRDALERFISDLAASSGVTASHRRQSLRAILRGDSKD